MMRNSENLQKFSSKQVAKALLPGIHVYSITNHTPIRRNLHPFEWFYTHSIIKIAHSALNLNATSESRCNEHPQIDPCPCGYWLLQIASTHTQCVLCSVVWNIVLQLQQLMTCITQFSFLIALHVPILRRIFSNYSYFSHCRHFAFIFNIFFENCANFLSIAYWTS